MRTRALRSFSARLAGLISLAALVACAKEGGLGPRSAGAGTAHADARDATLGYPLSDASPEAPIVTETPVDTPAERPRATFRDAMPETLDARAPAVAYGGLSASQCKAEVKRRELAVAPVKSPQRGVSGALKVTGVLNGVRVIVPPDSTKFGVLDCRLALVLDDLTKTLAKSNVVSMRIDNFYRPGAKLPGRKKDSQHAHGLAMDIVSFELADGRELAVTDWGAKIGEVPCGPDAVAALPSAESVDLRNLVCAIGRAGLFNTMLTPSFDAAHQSHFHFDIKPDSARLTVR